MNHIQLQGLTKRFGSTLAVDRLTFDVSPGTVTGFLGPNGAGKSTTMRMIIGLDRPDQGSALVNGKAYRDLRWPLREVGTLLNPRDFQPGRTARAHLAALAAGSQLPAQRVEEVLARTGLTSVIAAALVLTEGSVEKHIASVFAKLALDPVPEDNRRVLAVLRYLNA